MNRNTSGQTPRQTLFDLDIAAVNYHETVSLLCDSIEQPDQGAKVVVTPNVDHLVQLDKNPELKTFYAEADFIFADGMPVIWASKLLKKPLPERVTGADLFVSICEQGQKKHWQMVLIGGRPGEEDMLASRFAQYFPGLSIRIISPPMGFDPYGTEAEAIAQTIRQIQPQVVFVCLGFPKQERWALRYAATFNRGLVLCVGAAAEFALGLQKRAPLWMQKSGLEWLWRLLSNPKQLWRRYLLDDPYFLLLVWQAWRQQKKQR